MAKVLKVCDKVMVHILQKFYMGVVLVAMMFVGVLLPHSAVAKVDANNARGFLDSAVAPTGITDTDAYTVAGRVITAALGLVGISFFVLAVYAGFLWMLDRGNEEHAAKAKNILTAAIIGLVIVVAAYTISYFVSQVIEGGANRNSPTISDIQQLK